MEERGISTKGMRRMLTSLIKIKVVALKTTKNWVFKDPDLKNAKKNKVLKGTTLEILEKLIKSY
jgi:hypothetical protein